MPAALYIDSFREFWPNINTWLAFRKKCGMSILMTLSLEIEFLSYIASHCLDKPITKITISQLSTPSTPTRGKNSWHIQGLPTSVWARMLLLNFAVRVTGSLTSQTSFVTVFTSSLVRLSRLTNGLFTAARQRLNLKHIFNKLGKFNTHNYIKNNYIQFDIPRHLNPQIAVS